MQVAMPLELGITIEMDEPVRLPIEMTERLDCGDSAVDYETECGLGAE